MKALRLLKPYDMRFSDEPIPEVNPGEVLIKVGSVGVCASDVHYYREGRIGDQVVKDPLILGHEFSGTVVRVGDNVKSLGEGARVAIEPGNPCKQCSACKQGYTNLCPNVIFFGTPPIDGSLREYLVWPVELCIPIADKVSMDEAAMIEPLAVGVYAVELAGLRGGESVAVLGVGAIGLSVLQAARAANVGKIFVTDPVRERRELALGLGADAAFDPADDSTAEIIAETAGGVDYAFECAGEPESIRQTTELIRPRGHIMIVGIPEEDSYSFAGSLSRKREANVQFVRRSRETAEKSIRMVEDGVIDVASYATHTFPFERAEDAFKLAREKKDGVIRAVIRVSEE